jgi:hypothetical protein
MGDKRDSQRQHVLKAGTILFGGSGTDCLVRRLGARTSKSKAKPVFPIHSILSSTSSTAINTVTSFGGRHAESALHLISCFAACFRIPLLFEPCRAWSSVAYRPNQRRVVQKK